ncbi:magnesium transporter CorA family protein [Spongiactinospora sp. TRM90649]|uniref:magnesium transporter CorA family protein n=1 Tax=Spongiactinospora sp. TRM90649 TaxID=3031114 RepID=UPI0023F6E0F0|nr:magnesium transporter CorA family protein [Spongiactinospora sp. TRM90649]MDF5752469.1 magnesium transporter CorA family protein [Spongiactinospora sp. TRM90649]
MSHTRLYRDGALAAQGFPVADVSEHLADPSAVVWFDLCAPEPAELHIIREELGLHELAVEDVLSEHQRPKIDTYASHLFLTTYGTLIPNGQLELVEISIFVTKNALVTVRENDHFDIDQVARRWDATVERAGHGVAFLLHGLLDYVVDGHFAVVERLDEEVEDLEDQLFVETPVADRHELQRRTFDLRKNLVTLRRMIIPMREVIGGVIRCDLRIVGPEMAPYYQDVHDHVLRVGEWTESLRELVGNIRETHLTLQGYRLNDIMKRVTGWAAIIAVPTLITGFYGQNVPYPGSDEPWGFWMSTLVLIGTGLVLYKAFKRRDWL